MECSARQFLMGEHLYLVLISIAILCCHASCLACCLLFFLVLVRFLCLCRVLSSVGVITCFVFLLLFPFVVPERGLLFLSPSFKKPRFVGRLACCSVRSTLPESVGGSWALDFLRHPPVLKKDGCRLRPIAPAEPHHPQDLWGGRHRIH